MTHNTVLLDDDGHLLHTQDWNESVAQILADTLGIQLQTEHFQILYAVRDFYDTYHHSPSTRPLIKHLQKQMPHINNQALQKLFATGLVARHVSRIAGLPKPPNCL